MGISLQYCIQVSFYVYGLLEELWVDYNEKKNYFQNFI